MEDKSRERERAGKKRIEIWHWVARNEETMLTLHVCAHSALYAVCCVQYYYIIYVLPLHACMARWMPCCCCLVFSSFSIRPNHPCIFFILFPFAHTIAISVQLSTCSVCVIYTSTSPGRSLFVVGNSQTTLATTTALYLRGRYTRQWTASKYPARIYLYIIIFQFYDTTLMKRTNEPAYGHNEPNGTKRKNSSVLFDAHASERVFYSRCYTQISYGISLVWRIHICVRLCIYIYIWQIDGHV